MKVFFGANPKRLDRDVAQRVFNGVQTGKGKLREKIARKPADSYPPGLRGRLAALHWA